MKAVVLEVKNGHASVLKKNGDIVLIKQNELKTGDIIDIFGTTRGVGIAPVITEVLKRLAAAALVASVSAAGAIITYNTAFTASYVSIDINPAIEFELNRWNRVIGIESINDEALPVLQKLESRHLMGRSVGTAVNAVTEVLRDNSYIKDTENYILVNVASDDDARTEALEAAIEDALDESGSSKQIFTNEASREADGQNTKSTDTGSSVSTISDRSQYSLIYLINTGTLTDHQMARNLGISAGRYQAMRTVEARNSLKGSAVKDTARIDKRAAEIQIDKSLAERYKDATVEDLFKGSGAVPGSYKAPELKHDDGNVSIRDLNINYETRSIDESMDINPDAVSQVQGADISLETETQGLDPIEEAAILNESLENVAASDAGNVSSDTAGENSIGTPASQGPSAETGADLQQASPEKGPSVPSVPSETSVSLGPVPGSDSGNTTFGPQVPGNN